MFAEGKIPDGKLTAECSGRALAAAGELSANGGAIIQTTYTGAEEQQWKIEAL